MEKNGLFLISIGLIVFMLSSNAKTGVYDFLSIITSVFLIIAGAGLFFWSRRKAKRSTEEKTVKNDN